MLVKSILGFAALAMFAIAPGGSAQSYPQGQQPQGQEPRTSPGRTTSPGQSGSTQGASGMDRTFTGCVEKGSQDDEFVLVTTDGKRWDLESSAVKFEPHVGHTVTITGKSSMPDASGKASGTGTTGQQSSSEAQARNRTQGGMTSGQGSGSDQGEITVSKVTMVSATCQSGQSNPSSPRMN